MRTTKGDSDLVDITQNNKFWLELFWGLEREAKQHAIPVQRKDKRAAQHERQRNNSNRDDDNGNGDSGNNDDDDDYFGSGGQQQMLTLTVMEWTRMVKK